ncbi:hypothetical protein Micbo1qcDRAFT_179413 [Microdochium bolleyi]|uniref:Uncharacterized protein n=1 Tax=Microdochium bolleyi TaxID=196109 RepID=A0A136IR39_9PEZI|nr:hypothetical protein Micbo1qcDRAFT_179413 [Microdochium bolleyi]
MAINHTDAAAETCILEKRGDLWLAVLAEKYDCFDLFRPWMVSWHLTLSPGLKTDYAGVLSVAAARKKLYADLLREVQEPLDILINKPNEAKYCRYIKPTPKPSMFSGPRTPGSKDSENKDCESRILGKLIQDLARVGLWPLPTVDSVRISPLELGSQASPAPSFGSPAPHANCGTLPAVSASPVANSASTSLFAFEAMTISKTTKFKYSCTPQELKYLKAQADRTGAMR